MIRLKCLLLLGLCFPLLTLARQAAPIDTTAKKTSFKIAPFIIPAIFLGYGAMGGGHNFVHVFDPNELDSMFEDAARIIGIHQQGSTSLIQRKLKLGYNRAGRIIDQLKAIGIVGPFDGSKAREVLIPDDYALELFLNALRLEDGGEVAGTGVKVAVSENVVEREGNNGWSKIRSWFGY